MNTWYKCLVLMNECSKRLRAARKGFQAAIVQGYPGGLHSRLGKTQSKAAGPQA